MKRLDGTENTCVNACIYGRPGTGKTSFGVSAPKPLILLTEAQAVIHVKQAAQRLGVRMPPVFLIEHAAEFEAWRRALHGAKDQPLRVVQRFQGEDRVIAELEEWPETVVIDSLTDACRLIVDGIRRQSPPKAGKDGLPVDSKRSWGVLEERFKALVLGFRDVPVNTLFLCLADDRDVGDEDNPQRQVGPSLPMRKLPDMLAAAVNVIGYTYRREVREPDKAVRLVYGVLTVGPEYMLLKPYRPLRDSEVPNFSKWVQIIHGDLTKLPPAPEPSNETGLGALDEQPEQPEQAERSDPVEENKELPTEPETTKKTTKKTAKKTAKKTKAAVPPKERGGKACLS